MKSPKTNGGARSEQIQRAGLKSHATMTPRASSVSGGRVSGYNLNPKSRQKGRGNRSQ